MHKFKSILEFSNVLRDVVQTQLGKSHKVIVKNCILNSEETRYSLCFVSCLDTNVKAQVYLEEYYELYNQGNVDLTEIVIRVLNELFSTNGLLTLEQLHDFSHVKDKIVYEIINFERNEFLLRDRPHIKFLNLAITFSVLVQVSDEFTYTVPVSKSLHQLWRVSMSELLEDAVINTLVIFKTNLLDISEHFTESVVKNPDVTSKYLQFNIEELNDSVRFGCVTNNIGIKGAGVILQPGILDRCVTHFEDDIYVVFSSVHEAIVIPQKAVKSHEWLRSIIRGLTIEQSPEDYLSDSLYYYSSEQGSLIEI